MEILKLVQKYINTDIQSVINEMYADGCTPQLIHDTVQLLKLKDTVDLLLSNTKQWIIKYQIETDDPCTLTQVHRLIDNSSLTMDDKQKCYDNISNYAYFPDEFHVTYATEKIEYERHKRINVNKEIVYQPGDIKLYCKTPAHMIQTLQQKLKPIKSTSEPITYIMVGIQGSGKSTLSRHLEEQGIGLRFSTDEWDKEFWNCKNFIGIEGDSHIEMNSYIEKSLSEGYSVILDALHLTNRQREYLINRSQQYGKVVLIYMDTSIEECIRRSIIQEGCNGLSEDKLKNLIENTYNSMEIPTLPEGVDAIITNHYDETSKSYTVSVQCKESMDKGLVNNITTAINTLNMQQQILSYVHQYDGMEIQSVINEMYENLCSPQLIHDTVQLLKLKDTVEELKKNPDEWIRKHQVETDDPLSLKQLHGLLLLQDNYNDTLYDTLENSGYFPETLPLSYTVEIITCKRVQNNEIINNAGDIIIHTQLSSSLKNNIQHKITSFKTADDPMLILLSGYPASGKTTLAHILENKEIGINFEMDEWITKSLNCTHVIGTRLIVKEYNRLIREAIDKGINVIINNVNSTVNTRRNNILTYKKNKTVILFQDVSKNICLIRNCNREKVLPDVVINQIIDEFELPSLATDNVDAIITNRYDEDADSYIVSVESRDETFKEELEFIVEAIEVTNLSQQYKKNCIEMDIFDYVKKYQNKDIQTVISTMNIEGHSVNFIHDVLQLIKLKNTVHDFNDSVFTWINKNKIGLDPLTKQQFQNLLTIWGDSVIITPEISKQIDILEKQNGFPENISVEFKLEKQNDIFQIVPYLNNNRIKQYENEILSHKKVDSPTIILMVGCPGSGKSTISKEISQKNNIFRISKDEFANDFWGIKYPCYSDYICNEYNRIIDLALNNNRNIIIDDLHTRSYLRERIMSTYNKKANIIFLYMDTPLNICIERNLHRELKVNDIQDYYFQMNNPSITEGADAIITNRYDETSKSYNVSIESRNEAFKDELQEIIQIINQVNIIL